MGITFKNVDFEWSTGQTIFHDLAFSLEDLVYGLVGPNGIGKTTLASLVAGRLEPSKGSVHRDGDVYYFIQDEAPPLHTLLEYLSGVEIFDEPLLLGFLGELPFEQSCSTLSGGEWARVRLVKAAASGASFIILDEPTNHMDEEGRQAIHDFLDFFKGGVLIISHDRDLLSRVDKIFELSSQGLAAFTGNWAEYAQYRGQERASLLQSLEQAKRKRSETELARREEIEKQEKRQREGKKRALRGGAPKILLGGLKRAAQKTMGKIDKNSMQRVNEAVTDAWEAYQRVKIDPIMFAQLPEVELPHGKVVVEILDFNFRFGESSDWLWKKDLNFFLQGNKRVALRGANGSGKTTLLQLLNHQELRGQFRGSLTLGSVTVGFLDQVHSILDGRRSVLANVQSSSRLNDTELRNALAMFLFQGDKVHQSVSELSGGERLRAALAKLLLAGPPANVLILDEPTNNLDMGNVEFLESLLKQYKGALLVVSHDKEFIENLDIEETWQLE